MLSFLLDVSDDSSELAHSSAPFLFVCYGSDDIFVLASVKNAFLLVLCGSLQT